MKARVYCPNHGKLDLDKIIIKNGEPICKICSSKLEYCEVRPRGVRKK